MDVKQCNNLQEVRDQIDTLDTQIVTLIAQRNAYIQQAARFKVSVDEVMAPDRVVDVISHVREAALSQGLNPNLITQLYEVMIEAMVESEITEFRNRNTF